MDERNRRELMLDGLDCAICAAKVEKEINDLPGVTQAGHKEHEKNEENEENKGINKTRVVRLGIGAALFFTALLFKLPFEVELGIFLASYILVGGEVILKAVKNMLKGRVLDENFLMSAATIGAFAIKEFPEGVAVMLFYQVGELFQGIAVNRSKKSISALIDIRPDYANLKVGDEVRKVSPWEVS
ncbi:MAG: heavy metal translocating P-type ATPase, partial [Clostridiaceae bacterium]|nr:heavy metal translocating P-type ATPase [Clostridiaceae bacterium]